MRVLGKWNDMVGESRGQFPINRGDIYQAVVVRDEYRYSDRLVALYNNEMFVREGFGTGLLELIDRLPNQGGKIRQAWREGESRVRRVKTGLKGFHASPRDVLDNYFDIFPDTDRNSVVLSQAAYNRGEVGLVLDPRDVSIWRRLNHRETAFVVVDAEYMPDGRAEKFYIGVKNGS